MVSTGFNQIDETIQGTLDNDKISAKDRFLHSLSRVINYRINGLGGRDKLIGASGNDEINGGEGNDDMKGKGGDDTLRGGAGDDRYRVYDTRDILDETDDKGNDAGGNDLVRSWIDWTLGNLFENLFLEDVILDHLQPALVGIGNDLNNVISGNSANNKLYGLLGNDTLEGGGGDDYLEDHEGNNILYGEKGNDTLVINGSAGNNLLRGGQGNDFISALNVTGSNMLSGGRGDDTIELSMGSQLTAAITQTVDGGEGNDSASLTLAAIPATLTINLTNSSEKLITFGLLNVITDNTIETFSIKGSGNKVSFITSTGNDTLYGEAGNNELSAGDGADILNVSDSKGNNLLVGGFGTDTLIGGSGRDAFIYTRAFEGGDQIQNFDVTKDVIQVSASSFGGGLTAGILLPFAFQLGRAANDRLDRFLFDSATGDLFFDRDGNRTFGSTPVLLANISVSGGSFSHSNIVVVA
jgi:Ca2+-binding RTX toxin-like protein